MRAGLAHEEAEYEAANLGGIRSDTIDVGLVYGDTLTFSRRTALSFSTSTSATRWNDETHYRLNGAAELTRGFGRSGSGSLRYTRDTEFSAGFREPLLNDTVTGSVGNQIGRRTSWAAQLGYRRSVVGFESDATTADSVNASGRVTTALTRHLGLFSDYSYYRYEVPTRATVFAFLPEFTRHSVSVGLTVWAPLINDRRPVGVTR